VLFIIFADWCNGPERKANDMFSSIPRSSSLSINLELISFKPVIDVCGDSKVIKKILEEGESLVAADEGAAVTGEFTICSLYIE